MRASHRRLHTGITDLAADFAARPSRLPGWTVGHVLTHLARNADSVVRRLDGAERGEVVPAGLLAWTLGRAGPPELRPWG